MIGSLICQYQCGNRYVSNCNEMYKSDLFKHTYLLLDIDFHFLKRSKGDVSPCNVAENFCFHPRGEITIHSKL